MKRKQLCKAICCLVAALMMVTTWPAHTAQAADEFTCGPWMNHSATAECRTPMCDGTRLGLYVTHTRNKKCTYVNTGYTFTIPDSYVEDRGCC